MHYCWMESNSILIAYYCLTCKGQVYKDIKLKKFLSPIFSLKLLPPHSTVLICIKKTAGHSLKSLLELVSQVCSHVHSMCHFFRESTTKIANKCNGSVVKIALICQCYLTLLVFNGYRTNLVYQIEKWDNHMAFYCFFLLFWSQWDLQIKSCFL